MVLAIPAMLPSTLLTLFLFLASPSHGQGFHTLSIQTIPVATFSAPIPDITGLQRYQVISEVIALVEEVEEVEEDVPSNPTNTSTQTVIPLAPSAPAILLPVVHPNIDVTDYSNIVPQTQIQFCYSAASSTVVSQPQLTAFVDFAFAYPVVALEHIGYVVSISCSSTEVIIILSDSKSFGLAQNWPKEAFVLRGTSQNGCGTSDTAPFWALVSSVRYDSASFIITTAFTYITVKDVSIGFDINWGNEIPAGCSSKTTSSPAGASTTTPSSAHAAATSGLPSRPITTLDEQANFDEALDAALGTMDPTSADFYALLLPGVDSSTVSARDMSKRSLFSKLKALVKGYVKAIQVVARVFAVVQKTVSIVVAVIAKVIPPITITPLDTTIDINLSAEKFGLQNEDTIFGSGAIIYNSTDFGIYCVDCAFSATIKIVGTLSYTIGLGITKAILTASGPMEFDFSIALLAFYKIDKTYQKQLASLPITPFEIPEIVSIGPELTFGVGVELGFDAQGGVLAGIDVKWNGINCAVNLLHPTASTFSGLRPNSVTKTLELAAQIEVTGEAFVTIGLDFGIDILDGTFKLDGGFEEKPGIELDLTISDSITFHKRYHEIEPDLMVRDGLSGCQGVDAALMFKNELAIELQAGKITTTYGLNTLTIPITSYCYSFAHHASTPTKSSVVSTTTTTTTSHSSSSSSMRSSSSSPSNRSFSSSSSVGSSSFTTSVSTSSAASSPSITTSTITPNTVPSITSSVLSSTTITTSTITPNTVPSTTSSVVSSSSSAACGAPSAGNIATNSGFDCGTILPWTTASTFGGDVEQLGTAGYAGTNCMYTSSTYRGNLNGGGSFQQVLPTVVGTTYLVSFVMQMYGGGGNFWTVTAGGTTIANTNSIGVATTSGGFSSYSGQFTASTTADVLLISFSSLASDYAFASWDWDNFVVAPASTLP